MSYCNKYKYEIHYMPNHWPPENINYNVMIWKWIGSIGYVYAGYGEFQSTVDDCYEYINRHHSAHGDKGTAPYIQICGQVSDPHINGVMIKANIWGGEQNVKLSRWSEIKKLGFRPHHRSFSTISREEAQRAYDEMPEFLPPLPSPLFSEVPVLCFMTDRDNWWFTCETMDEINKQ